MQPIPIAVRANVSPFDVNSESPSENDASELLLLSSRNRIPALDGLRGIAILLVLLWHTIFEKGTTSTLVSHLLIVGKLSWSGVDLFFVLSGFLIGGILLDARHSPNYYKTFYARRGFRILPLYAAFLLGLGLVALSLGTRTGTYFKSEVPWFAYPIFVQNLWMAYFGTFGIAALAPTWSLAIEEQFYLSAPFVVRKLTRRGLAVLLCGIIVCAPLLRTLMAFVVPHGRFSAYFLMPCRADALSLGVLAALVARSPIAWRRLIANQRIVRRLTAILFLVLIGLTLKANDPHSIPMVTVGYSVLALFYTGCLLIILLRTGSSERLLCNSRLMQLGAIAYCTYLIHMPIINAGECLFGTALGRLGVQFAHALGWAQLFGRIVGVAVTLWIAKWSWRVFEKPLLKLGHTFKY